KNHVHDLVSIDFFIVPTIRFKLLFVLVVLAHSRRRVLHFNVTENPTAQWTAQQIVEVFPWKSAPKYLPSRSRCDLRLSISKAGSRHGDRAGCQRTAKSVAEPVRGAADRNPAPRLPRSCHRS